MQLPPFTLDHWLSRHDFAVPPIAFNLASSTGPRWSVGDLAQCSEVPLALDNVVLSYAPPQGSAQVRAAVAAFHAVDPEWVVMTTGASEALSILFCLASRSAANIVVPDPGYPAYAALAQTAGMGVRSYGLMDGTGFALRPAAVLAAVNSDTVAVVVNTPHNPTGVVMTREDIASLAAALAARSILLIVDEVYHPLYFHAPQRSAAGIPGLVVISDLSKALSLPGLRTGWIIESDPARRTAIIDARSYFTISGSPLLERLATCALTSSAAILDRLQRVATANLDRLGRAIENSGGLLQWTRPHGGTTCFPWFTDRRDSRPFCIRLAEAGVLVAPGDCFGHPEYMRIGFAQQDEGFDTAIDRFEAVLRSR